VKERADFDFAARLPGVVSLDAGVQWRSGDQRFACFHPCSASERVGVVQGRQVAGDLGEGDVIAFPW
jgi:hypothetical protein